MIMNAGLATTSHDDGNLLKVHIVHCALTDVLPGIPGI
jgi:hypothetical protein